MMRMASSIFDYMHKERTLWQIAIANMTKRVEFMNRMMVLFLSEV